MKILLIEDDFFQRDWMKEELEQELGANVQFLKTVIEFESWFAEIPELPNIFIIDVMLVHDQPRDDDDDTPIDADHHAGLRIAERLSKDTRTAAVPRILYTVLDPQDLPEGTIFIPKESMIYPLAQEIRRKLSHAGKRTARG